MLKWIIKSVQASIDWSRLVIYVVVEQNIHHGFATSNSPDVAYCFIFLQPGFEGRNCYADEHYLPTLFYVSA